MWGKCYKDEEDVKAVNEEFLNRDPQVGKAHEGKKLKDCLRYFC